MIRTVTVSNYFEFTGFDYEQINIKIPEIFIGGSSFVRTAAQSSFKK